MQMFSCLKVFVFLGIVFLLVFNTVDVNAQKASLTMITGDTDEDKVYDVGDRLQATFIASDENGDPAMGVSLIMTHSGLTDVTISNGGTTDVLGVVIVDGTIAGDTDVYIQADWPDEQQFCLPRNDAGPAPRTGFAPVASKTRGMNDARTMRHAKSRASVRSVPAANGVGVDECSSTSTQVESFFLT